MVGGGIAPRRLTAYLLLLAIIYLLQAFSPLRINTDSYRLLSMAVSSYKGQGYLVDGHTDPFPLGYPFIVKTLLQIDLANSMILILFNLVCLMVGLGVLQRWCKSQNIFSSAILAMAFVLSSWIMVKHVTLPLTELPYLALSSLSVFSICLFYKQTGRSKWLWFIVSAVLGYLALQCRSVALTIFPVIAITVLLHRDIAPFLDRIIKKPRYVLAILGSIITLSVLILGIIVQTGWYELQFVGRGSYFHFLLASTQGKEIQDFLLQNVCYRILEIGEIFANLPHSKTRWLLPILYCMGIIAWLVLGRGTWLLFRSKSLLPLSLYFLTYTALMCVWPHYDTRFWLPLLPLMAVMLLATLGDLQNRWPVVRFASQSYLVYFFLLGFVALAIST